MTIQDLHRKYVLKDKELVELVAKEAELLNQIGVDKLAKNHYAIFPPLIKESEQINKKKLILVRELTEIQKQMESV